MSLLVDLDNIMFHKGEVRVDVLKLRLKAIHTHVLMHGQILHWFCNVDTDAALKKAKIVLKGTRHVCTSEIDRADHALIQHATKAVTGDAGISSALTIVTADISLMRLAMYIVSEIDATQSRVQRTRLRFSSFNEGVTLVTRASSVKLLTFLSTSELSKFVFTLNLYGARYPVMNTSNARAMAALAAAKSRVTVT